jgi:uncharacterized protein DUF5691
MEFWKEITHTAMLGAGKKMPDTSSFPPALKELSDSIVQEPGDREEQFLRIAALAFNFRQCGIAAAKQPDATITKAQDEEKIYAGDAAIQSLLDVLEEENLPLLSIWLTLCKRNDRLVLPAYIPVLLNLATQHKKLRTDLLNVCGKRGQWLCTFNKAWTFAPGETNEEIWQTGALEQRKQVLGSLRKSDPAIALEWMQQTWKQEDANTKLELLPILETNIGTPDIYFLESLSAENSKKVKALALELLKKIPESAIVQQYATVLQQAIQCRKESRLLALSNKTVLQIALPEVEESVYKSGIEKLSSNKELSDELHIIYQLLQSVPPSKLEDWLQLTTPEIIDLFQKDKAAQKLLPALVSASIRFRDESWAYELIQHSHAFYPELLPLLPPEHQETFSIKFFKEAPEPVLRYALQREEEWSLEMARVIFLYAANTPYNYNRAFFGQHIHLLPVRIIAELEKFTTGNALMQNHWNGTIAFVTKLLSLKKRIIESFQS